MTEINNNNNNNNNDNTDRFLPPEIWREHIAPLLGNAAYCAFARASRRIWAALRGYMRPITGSDVYIRVAYDHEFRTCAAVIIYESRLASVSLAYNDLSTIERLVSAHERALDAHAARIHLILESVPDVRWGHYLLSDTFNRLCRRLHALVVHWDWHVVDMASSWVLSDEPVQTAVCLPLSDHVPIYHMVHDHEYTNPGSRDRMQRLHDAFKSYHAVSTVYIFPAMRFDEQFDEEPGGPPRQYDDSCPRVNWHGAIVRHSSNELRLDAQYIAPLLGEFLATSTTCRIVVQTPDTEATPDEDTLVYLPLSIEHKQRVPRDARGTNYDTFHVAEDTYQLPGEQLVAIEEPIKCHFACLCDLRACEVTADPSVSAQVVYEDLVRIFRVCVSTFIKVHVWHRDDNKPRRYDPGAAMPLRDWTSDVIISHRDGAFVALKIEGELMSEYATVVGDYRLLIYYRDALSTSPEARARTVFGLVALTAKFSARPDIQCLVPQWAASCLGEYTVKYVK